MNEEHIVINGDRYITVPDSLKKLGVQHDHNVETVTFDCPRYWDDHDLSTMNIYVNYMREDGKTGRTPCMTKTVDTVDPKLMHFTWTVPRHATEVHGTLAILVCIKSTGEDGVLIRDWNSEICSDFYISEGFEVEQENVDSYKDTLEAWYQSVVNMAIVDISQTTTSTENNGINIITATFGDGNTKTFEVRNGGVGPDTPTGTNYTITIATGDWVADGDRYSVTKTITGLTSDHVIFPSVSSNLLWIDNDLDVVVNDSSVKISVATKPTSTITVGLVVTNTVNGGSL